MFQHLANCHGEWTLLLALLGSLPFIGALLKAKMQTFRKEEKNDPR